MTKNNYQKIITEASISAEYLFHIIQLIKIYFPNLSESEIRSETLNMLGILLDKKIVQISNAKTNKVLEGDTDFILEQVDKLWFKEAIFPDFYLIILIERHHNFIELLKNNNYDFRSNWKDFLNRNEKVYEYIKI